MTIEPCPTTGSGVHAWLLRAANHLRHVMSPEQASIYLRAETQGCGRAVPEREIQAALKKAFADAHLKVTVPPAKRLEPSPRLLTAVDFSNGLAELWEQSPWECNTKPVDSCYVVSSLFPDDALICCAQDIEFSVTKPLGEWIGELVEQQFIVPNPMSAVTGHTQDGKISCRCLDNTGPRRFVNIEFDNGDVDHQAARIIYLMRLAPLALVCHSGRKSLHAWFYVNGWSEDVFERFFNAAVSLGADPANKVKCQFARMPEGLRDRRIRQALFYFDPEVTR